MFETLALILVVSNCGTSCPLAPTSASKANQAYYARIETISAHSGKIIHRANGQLHWDKKTHIGGEQFRGLPFDIPDYEINSRLIAPDKIWTSV